MKSLVELKDALRPFGYPIITDKNYLEIRLPLWTSLRIFPSEDWISVKPYFGAVPRNIAMPSLVVICLIIIVMSPAITTGYNLAVLFFCFAAVIYDGVRFLFSEWMRVRVRERLFEIQPNKMEDIL